MVLMSTCNNVLQDSQQILPALAISLSVDNKKCLFYEVVKMCNGLLHCVPLVEMVEKHIWNVQFGVRMRELYLRENICLGTRTFGLYFRSETGTSGG
jgi:hypothetical protein